MGTIEPGSKKAVFVPVHSQESRPWSGFGEREEPRMLETALLNKPVPRRRWRGESKIYKRRLKNGFFPMHFPPLTCTAPYYMHNTHSRCCASAVPEKGRGGWNRCAIPAFSPGTTVHTVHSSLCPCPPSPCSAAAFV